MHHEDAVEGALALSGIDLADLYRERMTLRQLWVRIRALPPESAVHRSVHEAGEKADADQLERGVLDALAIFGMEG